MLKIISQVCIRAPRVLFRGRNQAVPDPAFSKLCYFTSLPLRNLAAATGGRSGLRSFATIRLARAFDSRGDGILAARRGILAAFDQLVRALAQFFSFFLSVVAALI